MGHRCRSSVQAPGEAPERSRTGSAQSPRHHPAPGVRRGRSTRCTTRRPRCTGAGCSPTGRVDEGLLGAVGLLATPELALDLDIVAGSVQAKAWHRQAGGAVATLSTVDGIVFELAWFPTGLWQASSAGSRSCPRTSTLQRVRGARPRWCCPTSWPTLPPRPWPAPAPTCCRCWWLSTAARSSTRRASRSATPRWWPSFGPQLRVPRPAAGAGRRRLGRRHDRGRRGLVDAARRRLARPATPTDRAATLRVDVRRVAAADLAAELAPVLAAVTARDRPAPRTLSTGGRPRRQVRPDDAPGRPVRRRPVRRCGSGPGSAPTCSTTRRSPRPRSSRRRPTPRPRTTSGPPPPASRACSPAPSSSTPTRWCCGPRCSPTAGSTSCRTPPTAPSAPSPGARSATSLPRSHWAAPIVSAGLIETDALDRDGVAAYLSELADSNPELMEHVTSGGGGLIDGLQMRSVLTAGRAHRRPGPARRPGRTAGRGHRPAVGRLRRARCATSPAAWCSRRRSRSRRRGRGRRAGHPRGADVGPGDERQQRHRAAGQRRSLHRLPRRTRRRQRPPAAAGRR